MQKTMGLTQADLEKGLQALESAVASPSAARNAELFAKAQDGSITPEERDELTKAISANITLTAEATAPFTSNDTLRKSMDVSDFLREFSKGVVDSLTTLSANIEKSQSSDHKFRKALATTLVQFGEVTKSMADKIEVLEKSLNVRTSQPARAPKAFTPPQAIEKGFSGTAPQGAQLTKSQIEDAMSDMLQKGVDEVGGEPLLQASSKYESTNLISPAVLEAVTNHLRSTRAA